MDNYLLELTPPELLFGILGLAALMFLIGWLSYRAGVNKTKDALISRL